MNDLTTLLARGVESGAITPAQRDALMALAGGETERGPEARRGFNSITVAYGIGALLVVFGFGWFLADRWEALGPPGVLGVATAYLLLLLGIAIWFDRRQFREATAVALLVAVALTPVLSWAVQALAGLWPPNTTDPLARYGPWIAWRMVITELATIGSSLVAYRWRAHPLLMIPMAVALFFLGMHLSQAALGEPGGTSPERWFFLASALLVCAVAGALDRWQASTGAPRSWRNDHAVYFWAAGLLAFVVAYASIWLRPIGPWKHLLPGVAAYLIAMSLYLRRRLHLAVGLAGVFGYLAWLGGEVFKDVVSFPVLLATLGILLILVTVGVQRRFPVLVERVNAGREGLALPRMVTLGPVLLVTGIGLISLLDLPAELEERAFRDRLHILQLHSGSRRAPTAPKGRIAVQPAGKQ